MSAIVPSQKPDLSAAMAKNPSAVIEDVARDYGVTCRDVIAALPAPMRSFHHREGFVAAMQDIAEWGDLTVIIHTEDGIFEIGGSVPRGEQGHGYFNLMGSQGLHGHLRPERCGGIAFVERTFRGKASAFVAFLNVDGGIMFKVFVGRDAQRNLRVDQLARFHALAATSAPEAA